MLNRAWLTNLNLFDIFITSSFGDNSGKKTRNSSNVPCGWVQRTLVYWLTQKLIRRLGHCRWHGCLLVTWRIRLEVVVLVTMEMMVSRILVLTCIAYCDAYKIGKVRVLLEKIHFGISSSNYFVHSNYVFSVDMKPIIQEALLRW